MITWTEPRIVALKAHVYAGLSAGAIGRELGLSRGTVMGKVHRMGLRLKRSGNSHNGGRRKGSMPAEHASMTA